MASHDRRPARSSWSAFLWPMLLLLVLLVVFVWRFMPYPGWNSSSAPAEPRAITARGDLAEDEKTTIAIFREASPSVVHITTSNVRKDTVSLDLLQIPRGSGSGFIWDQDGHVVTNYHVIQGADVAHITLSDHSSWRGQLVGSYADKDLAVLKINAPKNKLRPIAIGAGQDLQVGQKVFAIGNPFGLDQSLTTGVISALGREIESVSRRTIKDMIQTDAAINPGNSGGPLLDSAGRLIGVNTAIFSPSGAYAGVGFAISVDEVNRVVPQLIRNGKISRPRLGVQLAPDQVSRQLGVKGVLILDVEKDSPAEKAGLQPTQRDENNRIVMGDVIRSIDDKPIASGNDLLDILEKHQSGDKLRLKVLREGTEREVDVTLSPGS